MQNSIIVNEWIILNDMVDITSNQQNGLQFILIIKYFFNYGQYSTCQVPSQYIFKNIEK